MKIAIYTSTKISAFDKFNIDQLVKNFPDAAFQIIAVKHDPVPFISRIKQFLIQLRDGIDFLKIDATRIEKTVEKNTKLFQFNSKNHIHVQNVNDSESERLLKKFEPDFIIQAGAGILKENIFSLSKKATLNVHHGFSPEIRGINSTFWCLYYGLDDFIGVTCHFIDATLDTGIIVKQTKINPADFNRNYVQIQAELCKIGAKLLIESIQKLNQTTEYQIDEKEIDSYYFSNVDYRKYTLLRKNQFKSIASPSSLATKRKIKKIIK